MYPHDIMLIVAINVPAWYDAYSGNKCTHMVEYDEFMVTMQISS
jgi:hypothetical protein